ncbi:MAG: hypothetical protein A2Y76_12680 [Planctomycetes bacterium RBG_13_60_9]|nr:MAG: hypothetical protein A2Y76_12680 [Planctomycetes bacterium RBG_13_60_9]
MRLSETKIIERLESIGVQYAPLVLVSVEKELTVADGLRADAIIRFRISDGPSFDALAEITCLASPKNVRTKSMQVLDLARRADNPRLIPLLVAPYVPPKQADALEEAGVSWLDLSGNMVIRVSDRIYIERTGRPNQFPDTTPIRKVFQGTASLVARALLLKPGGFASLSELVDFINSRNASIALSTASKVLSSLEEDLLVLKEGSRIQAIDPPKLLDRLAEGYASSTRTPRLSTYRFAVENVDRVLQDFRSMPGTAYVFCGFYAAELKGLAASTQVTMYVRDMARFQEVSARLPSNLLPDEEFGQLSITERKDQTPWFNAQTINGVPVVDDIELYLEMMTDTPRGPKVAAALRSRILGKVASG